MVDIFDTATRSRIMSRIRGKNTIPEMEIRKRLFSLGFRYRLHSNKLPGKPDMVLPQYRAVIFFNGCFWHAHGCSLFKWPSTNIEFWQKKLTGNREKDEENHHRLSELEWRILDIWECSFRGTGKKRKKEIDSVVVKTVKWLNSGKRKGEIKGK